MRAHRVACSCGSLAHVARVCAGAPCRTLPVASVVVLDARTVSARSTPVHRSTVKVAEPSSDKFHASIVEALLDTLTDLAQSQAQVCARSYLCCLLLCATFTASCAWCTVGSRSS